ncbi:hypothetical protein [Candidatus Odyssella thessalonicensis]|uniref:hypothetical protein n=1 Tax=Candidatus Odyssella thessalonicensis TaxID=84647 RepID=UPI0002F951CB|nr:hypothetical protein [Candidatus Odyssella thessalonicensis]
MNHLSKLSLILLLSVSSVAAAGEKESGGILEKIKIFFGLSPQSADVDRGEGESRVLSGSTKPAIVEPTKPETVEPTKPVAVGPGQSVTLEPAQPQPVMQNAQGSSLDGNWKNHLAAEPHKEGVINPAVSTTSSMPTASAPAALPSAPVTPESQPVVVQPLSPNEGKITVHGGAAPASSEPPLPQPELGHMPENGQQPTHPSELIIPPAMGEGQQSQANESIQMDLYSAGEPYASLPQTPQASNPAIEHHESNHSLDAESNMAAQMLATSVVEYVQSLPQWEDGK